MIDVIEQDPTQIVVTGRTDEVPLTQCYIPGQIMGTKGELRVNWAFTHTGGASVKTFRVYLGGQLIYTEAEAAGNLVHSETIRIRAVNSYSAQLVCKLSEFTANGQANDNEAFAINMALDQSMKFTAQLADGADTFTFQGFTVEYLRAGP